VLARASLERLWTPAPLAEGGPSKYGLGWSVYELRGRKAVGHEGGGCAWVVHLPDERLSVIALSNMAGARADETADEVAKLLLGT
jgi:CubicO group peptidase (beta-lactamase class C family)